MSFIIKINQKEHEIKFNYKLMFRANKEFASVDDKGNKQSDGAGVLFSKILENDDDALIGVIRLAVKGKLTDDEIFKGVEDFVSGYTTEEEGYQAIFDELKAEMVRSGFFKKRIEKYIENMEKAKTYLKGKEDDQTKMQVKAIEDLIKQMKNELSSSPVQEEA